VGPDRPAPRLIDDGVKENATDDDVRAEVIAEVLVEAIDGADAGIEVVA
jgi:hypothetical protein